MLPAILAPLLVLLAPPAAAQSSGSAAASGSAAVSTAAAASGTSSASAANYSDWPDWTSNDYDCVIGCLSGFNSSTTTTPDTALEGSSIACVTSTCDEACVSCNVYQAMYYIHLFYATGSIYEAGSSPSARTGASSTSLAQDAVQTSAGGLAGTGAATSSAHAASASASGALGTSENAANATSGSGNTSSAAAPRALVGVGGIGSLGQVAFAVAVGVVGAASVVW